MQHIWSVLCKNSIIDNDTNFLSIQNCIDGIVINGTKNKTQEQTEIIAPINFELINLLFDENVGKKRKSEIKIELYDPTNKKLRELFRESIFSEQNRRLRVRIKINGLPITSQGTYMFKISLKEKNNKYIKVAEIPLDVAIES